MESTVKVHKAIFRVLDALKAPYGGWLLKLRFEAGDALTIRELRTAILCVSPPDGATSFDVRVNGFPVFGGQPSDDRLRRTGRVDLHVDTLDGSERTIGVRWKVSGPRQ